MSVGKRIEVVVLATVTLWALTYLAGAFVAVDFNPKHWEPISRLFIVFLWAGEAAATGILIFALPEPK